jgi:hypothetical protein
MGIDPKQLQRDARLLKKTREQRKGPGTTAAVRAALPTIYRLRADRVHWSEIAAALGKQGVVQGKGKNRIPITTTRLTSLVRQIEAEIEKGDYKPTRGEPTGAHSQTNALQKSTVSLSVELAADTKASDRKSPPTEEDLRRAALGRIQDVLKKD